MNKPFLFFFISCLCLKINAQSVQEKMDSLRPHEDFYEFYDKETKKLYAHGWIEQVYAYPVFRTITLDMQNRKILLEGILTMDGNAEDTTNNGYCCFDILVGQITKKGTLYNIRRFGNSLMKDDSNNTSGRDGFFSIESKLFPNDILIIGNPGRAGSGAVGYYIGKLLIR